MQPIDANISYSITNLAPLISPKIHTVGESSSTTTIVPKIKIELHDQLSPDLKESSKGKNVVNPKEGLDLNKPLPQKSKAMPEQANFVILSDSESDGSVNIEDAGHESLFGRHNEEVTQVLFGMYARNTMNNHEPISISENSDDQVVPDLHVGCPRPYATVMSKLYSLRLVRCTIRSNNPGDNGLTYYATGGTKFKVLYEFIANRFNYESGDLCLHLNYHKVLPLWTVDEVGMENNATLYVHGLHATMNVDSRFKYFNMRAVRNFPTDVKIAVLANVSVEELYHAWSPQIGREVSTFRLACHDYELPPTGMISDVPLRNEDIIYTILKK